MRTIDSLSRCDRTHTGVYCLGGERERERATETVELIQTCEPNETMPIVCRRGCFPGHRPSIFVWLLMLFDGKVSLLLLCCLTLDPSFSTRTTNNGTLPSSKNNQGVTALVPEKLTKSRLF